MGQFIVGPAIPVLVFIDFFLLLKIYFAFPWRQAFIFSLVIWASCILAITELLSPFHRLDYLSILFSWLLLFFCMAAILIKNRNRASRVVFEIPKTAFLERISWAGILAIIATTALIAFFCPPNTYDSLTYHMARVAHWVQDRTIVYYPTHIPRQLVSPPWVEYAALHFQILSNGDCLANAVQWFCMIGSLIGVSLIAKALGAGFSGQTIAAVLTATIPMGIIQSTSLQGDYAEALWLLCALYVLLSKDLSSFGILIFSLSIGLAVLSKGTGVIFIIPLVIGFFLKIQLHLAKIIIFISIVAAITAGYLMRNERLLSGTVSVASQVYMKPQDISWVTFVANTLRNAGMNSGTGIKSLNKEIEKSLYRGCVLLGGNINDPKATYGHDVFHVSNASRSEDTATNNWHFALYLFCFFYAIWAVREKVVWVYMLYLCGMFLGLVLFMKWQVWISRFQLPLFVLFAPMAGFLIQRINLKTLTVLIVVLSFAMAVPYLSNAYPRHLVGQKSFFKRSRLDNLFEGNSQLMDAYAASAGYVQERGCKKIGLVMGEDSWDYPFYAILNPRADRSIRIEHVMVDNFTNTMAYPLGEFSPCAVIVAGPAEGKNLKIGQRDFALAYQTNGMEVFEAAAK